MDKFITAEIVIIAFGTMGVLGQVVAICLSVRKLFGKRPDQEGVTRREYDKDSLLRAEQIAELTARCVAHEATSAKRTDLLIESMTQLRVEVASLTAHLQRRGKCRTKPSPPHPLPPSSALSPRPSRAS